MIKKTFPIIIILVFLVIFSCDLFDPENNEPPVNMSFDNDSIPDWYPSKLIYSHDRGVEFNALIDTFKASYGIASITGLTFNPLLSNIEQLHSCPIHLCDFSGSEDTLETYRNTVSEFASDWWRLLCLEEFEIDSLRASLDYGRFYPKSHYETPVYHQISYLGYVNFHINTDGKMDYLSSSLIPQLPVPRNPLVDIDSAIIILEDYTFTINRWPNVVEYSLDANDTTSTQLEVYIPRTYDNDSQENTEVTYRLVWRISIFDGDLFVDAITGEILGFIQTVKYG